MQSVTCLISEKNPKQTTYISEFLFRGKEYSQILLWVLASCLCFPSQHGKTCSNLHAGSETAGVIHIDLENAFSPSETAIAEVSFWSAIIFETIYLYWGVLIR